MLGAMWILVYHIYWILKMRYGTYIDPRAEYVNIVQRKLRVTKFRMSFTELFSEIPSDLSFTEFSNIRNSVFRGIASCGIFHSFGTEFLRNSAGIPYSGLRIPNNQNSAGFFYGIVDTLARIQICTLMGRIKDKIFWS